MSWTTKCDLSDQVNAQFQYCANGPAALAFSVFFGLSLFTHVIQAIIYRKRFCWVIIMAVLWETAGFALRTYATKDQTQASTESSSQLLILLAPLWVNAFVYMTFGRMVWYYLPEQKIAGIKAEKMAKVFVWLDITSFLIQATGGVMSSTVDQTDMNLVNLSLHIYVGGIALQEFFIVCFLSLAITFHRKMIRGDGNEERGSGWRILIWVMYATLTCISIRVIYRLAEFAGGIAPSVLQTNEAFFYVLEASPMLIAVLLWNFVHPGTILVGPESTFPKSSRKERKEAKRERKRMEKEEKREKKMEKKARKYGKGKRLGSDDLPMHMDDIPAQPMPTHGRQQWSDDAEYAPSR